MNPMQDFSTPRAPAPAPAPPLKRRRRPSRAVIIAAAVLVVGGGALAFAMAARTTKVTSTDPRFCEISLQLSQALSDASVPAVGPIPPSVRPESVGKALAAVGGSLDEFERVAPSKVRADVKRVVADLRAAAAGDTRGVGSAAFTSAEERIARVQQPPNGCPPVGSGAGDG